MTSKILNVVRQVAFALIVLMLLALPWIVREQLAGPPRSASRVRATY
jgi:hypothetical protein